MKKESQRFITIFHGRMSLSAILVALLILSLAGCGPHEGPKAPKLLGSRQTLNITMSLSDEEWNVFRREIFPQFERKHNAKIKAYQIESGQLFAKLEAGKSEIDLFSEDNMELARLVEKDLVLALSEYEKEIPEEVLPNIVESCKFGEKLMFMPFKPDIQIVYYNQDAFRTYDLTTPKRWDALIEAAQKFKESEGKSRILLKALGGNPTATQIYEFVLQSDGEPYAFDDVGCIQTFRFLQKLWQYASEESLRADEEAADELLARQEIYLVQNRPFSIISLNKRSLPFTFKTYSGWQGPAGEHHVIGGDVFGIPKNTRNEELALKFIAYMQTKEAQEILVSKLGWPSIRQDAYEFEGLEHRMKFHYQAIKEAMEHGVFIKNVTWWPVYAKYVTEAFREIVLNGAPVEEALTEYKLKLEEEKAIYQEER